MCQKRLNEIMQKINALDAMLEDAYGEESEEYKLRSEAIEILSKDVNNALKYFEECGKEDFSYFLGYLDEICNEQSFFESVIDIENRCYGKIRGHNKRLDAIGLCMGVDDYYKKNYQKSREWVTPITLDYLKKEIGEILEKIKTLPDVNDEDYPCFTPEEKLYNEAMELLLINRDKSHEFFEQCDDSVLAYFWLGLGKILYGEKYEKTYKVLYKRGLKLFFGDEKFVDRAVAKKYLIKLSK
jgi:hypothetical protein